MNICGIIAEYNPFHNGHKYHIDYTRRELSCDYIIAVMSGSFVQRGAPAVIDKYYRARMALLGGADIVIELPAFYALQSAQYFALGSVSLLDALGVVDHISYGTEAYKPPQSDIIDYISKINKDDMQTIESRITTYLTSGNAYPLAFSKSIVAYMALHGFSIKDVEDTLHQPNAMLELMYLDALKHIKSDIISYKVARKDAAYHDTSIKGAIASATAIRRSLGKNKMYLDAIPRAGTKLVQSALYETNGPVNAERFFKTFLFDVIKNDNALSSLADISGGLDKRMLKMLDSSISMDEYIKNVKSKSYTYVRIARAIFNNLLGITADDTKLLRHEMPMYARVLGFKKEASKVIDLMHDTSSIPVFTQTSQLVPLTVAQKRLFEIDLKASDIYNIHAHKRFVKSADYKNQVIII